MSKKFVGLHAHTTFSIGDAIGYPKDHFEFALENGMDALAITDHGNANAYGYVAQVASAYKKKGTPFKPIFGVEAYIHPSIEQWAKLKESSKNKEEVTNELVVENEDESKKKWFDPIKRRHHLVILAQNKQGLHNLFRLVSKSYREGFYRMPRIDFDMLTDHNEGLIISTACLAGLPSWLAFREEDKGTEAIQKAYDEELLPLLEIFGKDRAFLELQFNKLQEQKLTNRELIKFSMRSGYSLIAAADSHYARPEWWRERELNKIMAWQSKGWKPEGMELPEKIEDLKCELYPKNGDQMFESYKIMYPESSEALDKIVAEAIERTHEIAHEQIGEIVPDATMKLPVIADLKKRSPFEILKNLCIERMKELKLDSNKEYINRLGVELKTIKKKEFSAYFLTLHRALNTLRNHMLVGPARGSGAGSLVCYLLKITQLDPIRHNLLFERFLAEHREGAPDIDTDIEDKDLCLQVLKEEFGEYNVIPVSNFNTLQLKSLVKGISKVYDIPYMEVNEVTTKMEDEARQDILDEHGGDQKFYVFDFENAKKYSPTFQKFLSEYPEIGDNIEVLFKQIKSIGRHAGGVIICDDSESCMPVIRIRQIDQTPWTEGLTAHHCEPWGLIKYDFLGLATLRFIRRAIELILKKQDKEPTIQNVYEFYNEHLHPDIIDSEDQKIFQYVYQQGRFPGIFQFTETNAQNFCKRARPTSVGDISALTSIYRPGPLCLSKNTNVLTGMYMCTTSKQKKRGCKYKNIKDLYEKFHLNGRSHRKKHPMYVYSYSEDEKKLLKNKILNIYSSGEKEVFKILFKRNLTGPHSKTFISNKEKYLTLEASDDHKFLTLQGWKPLKDIKRGEYLFVLKKTFSFKDDPRAASRKKGRIQGLKNFRNICFKNYQYKCVFCDWDKGSLDVNHVRENRFVDNNPENLSFLCPNHHREYSENSIQEHSLLKERENYILPQHEHFEYVRFLGKESCGIEETYDISVESPNNNFIAGGFVVHNSGHVDKLYTQVRHGEKEASYDHPILKEVLGETYGFIVYQEQFMLLANKLAGFTLSETDKLRKLLVRPETSMAEEMKVKRLEAGEKFIQGCVTAGLTKERATKLWEEEILGFISYGFNKSHAMAYAYISYQCAWLYTYHEKEWIRAYLENDSDRDKAIADVEAVGYKVGKLDINRSGLDWEIDENIIYPSLMTVKGIGEKAAVEVVEARESVGGSFESLDALFFKDGFTPKTKKPKRFFRFSKFNKRAISALIQVEAFDSLDIIDPLQTRAPSLGKFVNYKQMHNVIIDNFAKFKRGTMPIDEELLEKTICSDWNDMEKIEIQKELLGTYDKNLLFTQEVLDMFREHDIRPLSDIDESPRNIWFILKDYKQKTTSTKKPYVSLKITDVDDRVKTLNYFGRDKIDLKRRCVYIGTLYLRNGWINTEYNTKVVRVS